MYLLESADDIANIIADIEDGFKKKLFHLAQLEEFFANKMEEFEKEANDEQLKQMQKSYKSLKALRENSSESYAIKSWLGEMQGWFINCATFKFGDKYDQIMEGTYKQNLLDETFHQYTMKILTEFRKERIFTNEDILRQEISGKSILKFLLDTFVPAVLYFDEDFDALYRPTSTDQKLISLISENYVRECEYASKEKDEAERLYLRLLLVVDFLSGMTDSYAKNLYRELRGIE